VVHKTVVRTRKATKGVLRNGKSDVGERTSSAKNTTADPEEIAIRLWVPNTRALFSIAVAAAKGIGAKPREGGQNEALVSIVFAAASLEAFLSESAYLAEFSQHLVNVGAGLGQPRVPEPGVVSAFAQVMDDAEGSKASLESKFHLANLVLTGEAYDRGAAPYQDFALLIDARNALVHFKSKEYFSKAEGKPAVFNQEKVVEKLKSHNLLHEPSPGAGAEGNFILQVGDKALANVELVKEGRIVGLENARYKSSPDAVTARWTFLIGTKAVAQWACKTAAAMALDLIEKVPNSNWKNHMQGQLRPVFSVSSK
jgi:hypothetical protein